jgi:Pyruvate/2-oxoacid:ferredoxin oxidoreductase gamma subunit
MVMFGAVAGVTGFLSLESLFAVIRKEAGKFSELNLEAVKQGYELGSMFQS